MSLDVGILTFWQSFGKVLEMVRGYPTHTLTLRQRNRGPGGESWSVRPSSS
jgi:hypothetical protein